MWPIHPTPRYLPRKLKNTQKPYTNVEKSTVHNYLRLEMTCPHLDKGMSEQWITIQPWNRRHSWYTQPLRWLSNAPWWGKEANGKYYIVLFCFCNNLKKTKPCVENRSVFARGWGGRGCGYKWEAWESVLGVMGLFYIGLWWWLHESIHVLKFMKLR